MFHFDQVANDWDRPEKVKLMQTLAEKTYARVQLKDNLSILDFGCGTGLFGLPFLDKAKSWLGIDTSDEMLKVLHQKVHNDARVKTININLETENLEGTFDLILSSMAFHHLTNPKVILHKLWNALNPQGIIAIVDLNKEDGSFHPDPKAMGVHHFGFTKEEIQTWIPSEAQFELETINSLAKNDREYGQFLALIKRP